MVFAIHLGLILFILLYTVSNDSGHAGFNPYLSYIIFIPTTLYGFFLLIKRKKPLAQGRIIIITGLMGIFLILFLDLSNNLVHYNSWVKRGMPEKGQWRSK